jgi:acetyl-CoA carboxylase, biotin carboxylase subunit
MFGKILVANRGEIAVRVIRTCRELGIRTVAVYSEADRDALHVRLADEAVCIGPPPAPESYLNVPRIISAAEVSGADAIHPGYGFLSENADFSEVCESCRITFIGPTAAQIRAMGDKANARKAMSGAGVPIVPGTEGPVRSVEEALEEAGRIGFPIMIKAVAGGGGKGMRIAPGANEFAGLFRMAQAEAEAAFGNGSIYLERYLARPRHVEMQVLGDRHGNVVHLGERDCSVQRRHQKLIEETPSTAVTPALRRRLGEAAVSGARSIGYVGAGTLEFLLDERGEFFFMEMNTRLQVEHPVTEMVTGHDLVEAQIRAAAGEPLPFTQKDLTFRGHAIECRINAEDPEHNFRPSPGTVNFLHFPGGPGMRVDSHLYQGYRIPTQYDSLVAKIVAWAEDRPRAIARMSGALSELEITGFATTTPILSRVLADPAFAAGHVNTHFLERMAEADAEAREAAAVEGG